MAKNKQLTYGEIAGFCDQMATILNAGISSYEGVSALLDTEEDESTKEILKTIYEELDTGHSFTSAVEKTGVFPPYVSKMISIGEHTGNLETVLTSLRDYCNREEEIQDGIRRAVVYPAVMIVMMIVVMGVLVMKVLPIFNDIYSELGAGLTGFSYTMLKVSSWLSSNFIPVLVIIVAIGLVVILYIISPKGRKHIAKSKLALTIAASRFASCMALALNAGLDTDQGMDLANELVENEAASVKVKNAQALVADGKRFEDAIIASGIFSGIYNSMVSIGAKTGALDEVMDKIAVAYDKKAAEILNSKISKLEPILVIVLSIIVGILLLSFLLPLIGIMSSIG